MGTECQLVVLKAAAGLALVLERLAAQSLGMLEEIANAARSARRQSFEQIPYFAAQPLGSKGHDIAELGDQAADAVERCGALLDEEIGRASCRARGWLAGWAGW